MGLSDKDLMPFGKYKGYKMEDVPLDYFKWLLFNDKIRKGDVLTYIDHKHDVLIIMNEKPQKSP